MVLHATCIFVAALLLFQVQPIVARLLLPRFGGSAAVWTTCLLFFQAGLLAGYFQAFWTGRLLGPRSRALLHAGLLALSTALLPIAPPPATAGDGAGGAPALLVLLARTVGLPYVLLAATGPLYQDWFAARYPDRNPYRLFALSNAASLIGLLAYPFLVEPRLGVAAQARLWSLGYALFAALAIGVALRAGARGGPQALPARDDATDDGGANAGDDGQGREQGDDEPDPGPIETFFSDPAPEFVVPAWHGRVLWLLLPACATLLLLSLTTHLTQDVAAIPLLFVLPLSVYLLTFILAFARRRLYLRPLFRPLVALALPGLAWLRFAEHRPHLFTSLALWSAGLFVVCMVLHGELARRKPPARHLTSYYLSIAAGGALGGVFTGLAAPVLFAAHVELELAMVLAATLTVVTAAADPRTRARWRRRPLAFAGAIGWVALLAAALALGLGRSFNDTRRFARNFYGALRVVEDGEARAGGVRKLMNGTTNHGAQRLDPRRASEPVTYYCAASGIGLVLHHHHVDRPRAVGVIGLGAGSLAAYGRAGDRLRFYEINPLAEAIARTDFSYLRNTHAAVEVVRGDARLSLEREAGEREAGEREAGEREAGNGFDVLAVDAFSSDAIPIHLLTREAFALYFRHLAPDGVLAVHISNRHLDLEPVVSDAATAAGRRAWLVEGYADRDRPGGYCFRSSWVIVGGDPAMFDAPEVDAAEEIVRRPGFRPWTDDYSNVLAVSR